MTNKYRLLVQYDKNAYEKVIAHIFKYTSKTETVRMGKIEVLIVSDEIGEIEVKASPSLDLKGKVSYETRKCLENYILNLYNDFKSSDFYNDDKFTGIDTVEIEEVEYEDVSEED